ncbi:MAG: CBS domain-containing protein [Limnospira sp. PMC 1291.21]|uniref:Polynucleotide adenylyltransferase region n=2 Tax=Limnospira TaxID=2596745 RepID=B5VYA5_LIMMA|nr:MULTISPECIES: CBS domain-containing protein [Limnospira]EKD07605.1 putative phosphoesterase RecJ-like protein [Arthrospira platensis C1]QJB25671.1 CBS domain-containing protein [Limnospira fusiformis SAG 85.79]EDZ95807.1 Polynucleotide adenylyltransferase region [Limnospira maxima CS-328]MDT9179799.1 CBS domain-containing protein [Limnospira sp. PMC 1238.20]MDT9189989.1 CBS domain-containing protein [Limnospira sp. PMC 894.15]
MHLILCHTTADFDSLGAAVGLTCLYPGSRIVLTGGSHPAVRDFLALYRDEFPLIERRSVNPDRICKLSVVDTQNRDRLGKAAEWLDLPNLEIRLYDHHPHLKLDIPATWTQIEAVGATTTLIVEHLRAMANPVVPRPAEATVMALGIHVDTGSLTFDHSTPRDAIALAWLMEQNLSLSAITEYVEPGLSPTLQDLLTTALETLHQSTVKGHTISWVLLETDDYVPGLSSLTSELLDLTESDGLLLANQYRVRSGGEKRLTIIGRSRIDQTDLNRLFHPLGGGGHPRAASVTLRDVDPQSTLETLVTNFKAQIPPSPTARELMSSPVRTIRPETSVGEAHRILLRYGHSGLSVLDDNHQLVGIISRRDIDIALHHGFNHSPVKGYMTPQLRTITPDTSLPEIESIMVTYDIGRLPVLENGNLVGIVTRTDVLRLLYQQHCLPKPTPRRGCIPGSTCSTVDELLQERLAPELWQILAKIAELSQQRGWQIYLVGGGVRDLLLAESTDNLLLHDIDLVVDGCYHNSTNNISDEATMTISPAVELARSLQEYYPQARLEVHGQFQTAALLWHNHPVLNSLWIDIATARTEFYPYPAANPEVEASSIRQDLYRRDFTINALALRLNEPNSGELLDFFGGVKDLELREIRVLHPHSFIEDPTRIYRAVRFAVRLGFSLEHHTKEYVDYAINSGIYDRQRQQRNSAKIPALEARLKSELKYILQAPYWQPALHLLGELKALRCIHPTLELNQLLWRQIRTVDRCLKRFDPNHTLAHWQIRLDVLIAALSPEYRREVADIFQFNSQQVDRLLNLENAQTRVADLLPNCQQPSDYFRVFEPYDLPMLILIASHSPRWVRKQIWRYLNHWWNAKPILNGNDLKKLGYKPGPKFQVMLNDLLNATLDGIISDTVEATKFISDRYPHSRSLPRETQS